MGNVLQFTLGLATGGFLSAVAGADSKVRAFIGGMVSLGAITHGVMSAIERGAALNDLSKQTGESVENLYKLQKGFKAAGLSGEDVGTVLFMMNKALGGVNELGESTSDVFTQMGLSVAGLKKMAAPEALTAILGAMNKLGQSGATKAASSVFGRMQAANMLLLARSSGEFGEALKKAAERAKFMQKYAETFERLDKTLDAIKSKGAALFEGIAAGVAPGIQAVADVLNKIDLSRVGRNIGMYLTALAQAFKEGSLSELIGETFKTGFDIALAYAPGVFEKLGAILIKSFSTPLTWLQAGLEHIFYRMNWRFQNPKLAQKMDEEIGAEDEKLNKVLGPFGLLSGNSTQKVAAKAERDKRVAEIQKKYMQESWEETLQQARENADYLQFDLGFGTVSVDDMNKDAARKLEEGKQRMKEKVNPLLKIIKGLAGRAGWGEDDKSNATTAMGGDLSSEAKMYKPDFTSLEKMGFVMNGMGNPMEYLRQTAANTARIAERIESLGSGQPAQPVNLPA